MSSHGMGGGVRDRAADTTKTPHGRGALLAVWNLWTTPGEQGSSGYRGPMLARSFYLVGPPLTGPGGCR